ncbi:MAG: hypothetical protein LBL67_02285 [Coriobacteriales bacterium]|jgi:hypothetical protein|nr:hypothetical protein [Coriobacteriales bacterium]
MQKDNSTALFAIMGVIVVIEVIVCIICPIAIANFEKNPVALPLMIIALLLPYIYFFVFAGIQAAKNKAAKKAALAGKQD